MLGMKLTLQTQLLPTPKDAAKLMATVERFNEAATWLAGVAFDRKLPIRSSFKSFATLS